MTEHSEDFTAEAEALREYILSEVVRRHDLRIDDDTPLVSSGLVDSMALVDILLKLEDIMKMRIPAGKVQPRDMNTVRLMIATARRVGKVRR